VTENEKGFKTEVSKPFCADLQRLTEDIGVSQLLGYEGLVAAASTAAAAVAAATGTATAVRAAAVAAATGTATAAAAAATAATVAAATTTTEAAASAWWAGFHWTSFINNDATAAQRLTVHAVNGCLSFSIAAHLDKAKAFRATCVAFHHDFSAGDGTELTKRLLQIFVAH
jgi:hypothetical protein